MAASQRYEFKQAIYQRMVEGDQINDEQEIASIVTDIHTWITNTIKKNKLHSRTKSIYTASDPRLAITNLRNFLEMISTSMSGTALCGIYLHLAYYALYSCQIQLAADNAVLLLVACARYTIKKENSGKDIESQLDAEFKNLGVPIEQLKQDENNLKKAIEQVITKLPKSNALRVLTWLDQIANVRSPSNPYIMTQASCQISSLLEIKTNTTSTVSAITLQQSTKSAKLSMHDDAKLTPSANTSDECKNIKFKPPSKESIMSDEEFDKLLVPGQRKRKPNFMDEMSKKHQCTDSDMLTQSTALRMR